MWRGEVCVCLFGFLGGEETLLSVYDGDEFLQGDVGAGRRILYGTTHEREKMKCIGVPAGWGKMSRPCRGHSTGGGTGTLAQWLGRKEWDSRERQGLFYFGARPKRETQRCGSQPECRGSTVSFQRRYDPIARRESTVLQSLTQCQ